MEVTSKSRSQLKAYFVKNAIPTESNFVDLIDGMVNPKDDGIVKLPDNPLIIEAGSGSAGTKPAIQLYSDFANPTPAWTISLNDQTGEGENATNTPGLYIRDGAGNKRLFIDQVTGVVVIGNQNNRDLLKFDTERGWKFTASSSGPSTTLDLQALVNGKDFRIVSVDSTIVPFVVRTYGEGSENAKNRVLLVKDGGRVGIGTDNPQAQLQVAGGFTILEQEDWIDAELENEWENYSESSSPTGYNLAGYFKDSNGIVHLRGLVRNGQEDEAIFTLPPGYTPIRRELRIVATGPGDVNEGRIDIFPDSDSHGDRKRIVQANKTNKTWVSLDGISFRAAN